jgi:hypothetical protein
VGFGYVVKVIVGTVWRDVLCSVGCLQPDCTATNESAGC